jgi:hypothetical protein
MSLFRLIYRSEDRLPAGTGHVETLAAIVEAAGHRNRQLGVSGVLVYRPGRFLQVLEGPAAALEQVFESICRDPRHGAIALMEFTPVDQARFNDWTMVLSDARGSNAGIDAIDLALTGIASEGGTDVLIAAIQQTLLPNSKAA